jgi:hypothetical protein
VTAGAATVRRAPWALLGLAALAVVLATVAGVAIGRRWSTPSPPAGPPPDVRFQRITDFVGIEEMPAVSPDGKRFLVLTTDRPAAAPQLVLFHLVSNWRSLLEQRQ